MKKNLTLLFLFFVINTCFGQNEANVWYFGNAAGIDFNNPCNPIALTDSNDGVGFEGSSTISDAISGQFVLHTNGYEIYNKNKQLMGNVTLSSNSPSQTLILKKPKSSSILYVITPEIQGNIFNNNYGLHCAIVDLTLNGGLGGVTNNNNLILLNSPVTEKLTATKHANGTDIWIISHTYGNNNFNVFLLDSTGINMTPIISSIGANHISTLYGWGAIGEMKMSPNGQKIAIVNYDSSVLQLFDFNNLTGQITNLIPLTPENFSYGLSFSPDNSKLYATSEPFLQSSIKTVSKLYQFDISSNDSATIANSKTIIFSADSSTFCPNCDYMGSLKIAPDNKIYVGRGNQKDYLGVINNPNASGTNCNYVHDGFYLNGRKSSIGLNNAMEINYNGCPTKINDFSKDVVVLNQNVPNPFAEQTTISYYLPDNVSKAQIIFFDQKGVIIKAVDLTEKGKGQLNVFANDLSNGIYTYSLIVDGQSIETKKMVKAK